MRITLDLDDDVLAAIRERARREKRSEGEVLSEVARKGLTQSQPTSVAGEGRFGFHPLPRRGAVVTNELIDRLREEGPE